MFLLELKVCCSLLPWMDPLKREMKCLVVHLRNVSRLQRSIVSYGSAFSSLSAPPGLLETCRLSTHFSLDQVM